MRTKVLLALCCTLTCATMGLAQQDYYYDDEEDYPVNDNPAVVVTEGVPPEGAYGDYLTPPPAAPINEFYGPSSLPKLPTVAQLIEGIAKAEQANNANDLVYAYGEAVRNPALARGALTRLMYDYYRMRSAAVTPEQASQAVNEASLRFQVFQAAELTTTTQQNQQLLEQNAQIIRQNQQIIQLLQQIARK